MPNDFGLRPYVSPGNLSCKACGAQLGGTDFDPYGGGQVYERMSWPEGVIADGRAVWASLPDEETNSHSHEDTLVAPASESLGFNLGSMTPIIFFFVGSKSAYT